MPTAQVSLRAAGTAGDEPVRTASGFLLAVLVAQAALAIVMQIGWRGVASVSPDFDVLRLFRMQELISFALLLALIAAMALVWMRFGEKRPRRLVGAAVILAVIQAAVWSLSLPEAWEGTSVFGESPIGQALEILNIVLAFAGDILLFAGLSGRARTLGLRSGAGGMAAFVALRVARLGITLLRSALPSSMRPDFMLDPSVMDGVTALQLLLLAGSVALFGVLLVRLRAACAARLEGGTLG